MKKYSNARSPQISIGEREYDRDDGMPNWLKQFADNYENKTAVEVARERDESFSDQINSIMGNKSKFSTVEEQVRDYQDRTGLKAYLQTLSKKASNVAFDAGYLRALTDLENKAKLDPQKTYEEWVKSNSAAIKEDDYESWKNGYNKAYTFYKLLKDQLGEKNTDKEIIQRVKLILEDDKLRSSAGVKQAQEMPETTITEPKLFQKFPEIKYFVDNLVKTQHGNVHTPAILQDISSIYKNQGVTEEQVNDPEVLKYINDVIAGEQETHTEQVEHRVGEGVGVDDTHDNEDCFSFQSKMRAG